MLPEAVPVVSAQAVRSIIFPVTAGKEFSLSLCGYKPSIKIEYFAHRSLKGSTFNLKEERLVASSY